MFEELNYDILKDKYIRLMSDTDIKYNKTTVAKALDISRVSLYKLLELYPSMQEIIHKNIRKMRYELGNIAFKQLLNVVKSTSNPQLLKLALEIGEHHTDQSIVTNRFTSEEDANKALLNLFSIARNKREKVEDSAISNNNAN